MTAEPSMTEPTATPISQTTEFQLAGYPDVPYRWGSGHIRPSHVAITCLEDRHAAHLHGTWIREDGVQTDDPVGQFYRHDDNWPEELAALASALIAHREKSAIAPAQVPESFSEAADQAWGAVWLHGNWRYLTKQMTTEARELAAAAVMRWIHGLDVVSNEPPRPEPDELRWWRE